MYSRSYFFFLLVYIENHYFYNFLVFEQNLIFYFYVFYNLFLKSRVQKKWYSNIPNICDKNAKLNLLFQCFIKLLIKILNTKLNVDESLYKTLWISLTTIASMWLLVSILRSIGYSDNSAASFMLRKVMFLQKFHLNSI